MATLRRFSASHFSSPVSGTLVTCSPTIDLVATASDGSNVQLWRANGELVVKLTEKNRHVLSLAWKHDGRFLAVGWSDGVVRLMGLENNKAVHHIRLPEGYSTDITCIAWPKNYTGSRRRTGATNDDSASWDKLLDGSLDLSQKDNVLDLPHELTFLEIEISLPKLSPLPVTGGSGDDDFVFSTRASLDFIFRPVRTEDTDSVDVMIVGTDDGGIHLNIYDSFVIGSFRYKLPGAKDDSATSRLWSVASHAELSSHSLLFRPRGTETSFVNLVPMDLTFVHSSPVNLCLLASKTTALQNLLRYIKQTQLHMVSEWKSARELPERFLSILFEDLQAMPKGKMTVVQALYHTVLTGHVFSPVKAWLVDSLAERGHKRWVNAAVTGLENLRALVHQNMLPALERCIVILSRLQGLARYHDAHASIGFRPAQIKQLMDIVSCLNIVSHRILLEVMEELDLFAVFSSWLRFQIDKQASSSASDELTEKEATMDNIKVLAYIQNCLVTSPFSIYFDEVPSDEYGRDWKHIEDGLSLVDVLDKQLKRRKSGQPHMKTPTNVDFLVNYLVSRTNIVFKDIAEAQRRGVRFGKPTKLEVGDRIARCDMRLCVVRRENSTDGLTFTAIAPEASQSRIYLFRTDMQIINGISSASSTTACGLSLGEGRIIDFKFLDESSLLVLWSAPGNSPPLLLHIPYQSRELPYLPYKEGTAPRIHSLSDEVVRACSLPKLPEDAAFTALQMEVREPSDAREQIPARVCILGSDKATYKVFALPGDMAAQGWTRGGGPAATTGQG